MTSQEQEYKNIIPINTVANAISLPVFAQQFKTVLANLMFSADADFNIRIARSNKHLNPPDLSKPSSPNNQWEYVGYTDESGINYDAANPLNPTAIDPATSTTLEADTNAGRWFFVVITDYVSGTLQKTNMSLFGNFN